MSATATKTRGSRAARGAPEVMSRGMPEPSYGWVERMLSSNHKSIGILYVATALSFLAVAVVQWVLMRVQLIVPDATLINAETFNQLMTAQAATAVALFALPLAIGLATYVVPLQIGARGVALPRLAQLSYWLYLAGGVTIYASFLYNPSEGGTVGLPPLSETQFLANSGVDAWALGVALAVLGLVCASVNLVATVHTMRAPGLAWRRSPLFTWASTASAWVLIAVGPVMLAALTMLLIDRNFGGIFFSAGEGGSPMLYQHLAWIFFTGAWTVVVLFGFGVISEVVSTFTARASVSRNVVGGSLVAIAILGPLAWIQNMYTAPIGTGWMYFGMAVSVALLVPVGLILFNLAATLLAGGLRLTAPAIYAIAGLSLMFFGLAGELCYSIVAVGWQLSDTVAAHADTVAVLVGAGVLGGFAALHYWLPKLRGRAASDAAAKLAAPLVFLGMQIFLWASLVAALQGQPADMWRFGDLDGFATANLFASIGVFLASAGILTGLFGIARGFAAGRAVGPDPWRGATLEWFAPSPPPPHNFDVVPDVRSAEPMREIRAAVAARQIAIEPLSEPESSVEAPEPAAVASSQEAGDATVAEEPPAAAGAEDEDAQDAPSDGDGDTPTSLA